MGNWSVPVGRIFGIPLRVHFTFAFLILLFVWSAEVEHLGAEGVVRALGLSILVFGSVVLHEVGHAVTALRAGVNVRSIVLLPIGGVTVMDDDFYRDPQPRRDLHIAILGPLVNIALGVFAGTALLMFAPKLNVLAQPLISADNLPRSFVWANLLLGFFNLIPAYPLDGGRLLRSLLATRMDHIRATRRAVLIGEIFAATLILISYRHPSLMVIGFFLFLGAQMEDRTAVFHSVLESVRIDEIMLVDFATLSPADTLEDALQKAIHSLQDDFPVVSGGDMVGTISRQRILETIRQGVAGYVQSAMSAVQHFARPSDTLAAVLSDTRGRGLSLVPVVDGDRLVGIVTLQNLTHSMALLAETRRLKNAA